MPAEYDVVVAGAGIAGLGAALTSARLGRTTLVVSDGIGGQLLSIEKIEGYPGFPDGVPGYDLGPMAQEQAAAAGAEFAAATVERLDWQDGAWRIVTSDGDYTARGVVIATGSTLKELGLPGEQRLRGKGVSHCASCDAPLLRGRAVAVVGGGDSAMQEALTLAGSVDKVFLLHRGESLSGQASYRSAVAAHPKIETRRRTVVEEILGDATVKALRIRDQVSGAASELPVAAVFVYIGLAPCTAFLDGQLELDTERRIPTDPQMRTVHAGLCAAGSARSGWGGRAVISAGDGALAAAALDRYLTSGAWRDLT